jgi:ArsR family transcriptional regulator
MEFNTIEVLKALADPTRLAIVKRLYGKCELCACNMIDDFNITQPTLSFHMKKLTGCGLVNVRKEGVWMKYSVNEEFLEKLKLEISFSSASSDDKTCCEKTS